MNGAVQFTALAGNGESGLRQNRTKSKPKVGLIWRSNEGTQFTALAEGKAVCDDVGQA